MKLKKMLKMSLAVALVFGTAGTIVGCGKDDDKTAQKTQEEKVYDLYVSYMSAQGETPLTYEEWYATLKGTKGDKGDTGATGATGAPGAPGQNGKDGATWYYGTESNPSSSKGKIGDFYFNKSTQSIYVKDSTGWVLQATIEDGTNGIAPQIRINPTSNKWEISIDGGFDWLSTDVKALGEDGEDGDDGRGIVSIEKTSTVGNVDTYTVTYTTGEPTTFTVVNGTNGEDGEDGATWYTDEGTPEEAEVVGKEGDLYLDTATSNVYKKGATEWTQIANIKGAEGEQGEPGAAGSNGENGEDGTTWHSGVGAPESQQDLVAKEGDFYFDTLDNEIYLYDGENWISQVDLTEDVVVETIQDNVTYTGNIVVNGDSYPFEVVFETEGTERVVKSLSIAGPMGQMNGIELFNPQITINGNVVALTLENKAMSVDEVQTLILTNDNVLETYISEEELGLLKGVYESYNGYLIISDGTFAMYHNGSKLKGTWRATYGHSVDGRYELEFTTEDNKVFSVDVSYYYRSYNISVQNFSGEYVFNEDTYVYDSTTNTLTLKVEEGEEEPIEVTGYAFKYDDSKYYITYTTIEEEEEIVVGYSLDYVTGNMTEVEVLSEEDLPNLDQPLVYINGSYYAIVDNEGVYELEEIYDYVMLTSGTYKLSYNLSNDYMYVTNTYDGETVASIYSDGSNVEIDQMTGEFVCTSSDVVVRLTMNEEYNFESMTVEYSLNDKVDAEGVHASLESDGEFINSYYNKTKEEVEELNNNLGEYTDNLYTKIGTINYRYYGNKLKIDGYSYSMGDNITISVGNGNFISLPAWKLGEYGDIYVSSMLLKTAGLNNNGVIEGSLYYYDVGEGIKTYETPFTFTVSQYDKENVTAAVQSVLFNSTELTPEEDGSYLYESASYLDSIKFYFGEDAELANAVAFTVKECMNTAGQYAVPSYGYTKLDVEDGKYYLIFYPYYYMGEGSTQQAEYTYTYTFILNDGSHATYTIRTIFNGAGAQ